ncbi:hypothetical protein RFN28_24100 [Mesorhizobium sp. VK24D]|uniref:Uncharacterized protein n=1 Tax=Mesorhizobium album TaxID=3072314 RepID=A0ABU4Y494_9HYPH|nr:hypothetical protein [Mesorhizobium sp. VK24D]MDX8481521.1 hypothetical protein [Mesorhizobium sp. VK24D]
MEITAAEFLAPIRDQIAEIKQRLTVMDDRHLEAVLEAMPKIVPAGSAEMVLSVLLYGEIAARENGNVLPFPSKSHLRSRT